MPLVGREISLLPSLPLIRQMLGPFRGNDIRTALRTLIDRYSSHGRFLLSLLLRRICVAGKGSIAWQRRNRANIVVFASSYSVAADIRLVFLDEI